MVRTSVLVVGGLLAAGADAFMAPSAAGMWLSKPLLATRAQGSGMSRPRTSVPRSELRMGGALEKAKLERPELPMKRAFLWRYSELVLDKAIYFLQVAVMLIYRKILYKLAVKMNFAEEPDQTSSIRQDMIMDPRLFKASWDNEVNTAGVFAQGANGESYRIGTASQAPMEAPTITARSAITFLLFMMPFVSQIAAIMSQDKYWDACASASTAISFMVVLTDLLAGSPSGLTVRIRRALPVEVRKLLVASKRVISVPKDDGPPPGIAFMSDRGA